MVRRRVGSVTAAALDTRTRILDAAERLAQRNGLNGFSYAGIATELSVTKPALHYHFPTKAMLGEALVARPSEPAPPGLGSVADAQADAHLDAFVGLYRSVLQNG